MGGDGRVRELVAQGLLALPELEHDDAGLQACDRHEALFLQQAGRFSCNFEPIFGGHEP
jgi:hypothetical protein